MRAFIGPFSQLTYLGPYLMSGLGPFQNSHFDFFNWTFNYAFFKVKKNDGNIILWKF